MGDTACSINNIESLTHVQARRCIDGAQSLILPLGGCEPFGDASAMGAETVCAVEVARELSRRRGVPAAPAIPFGCSSPFASFAGTMAVKPRTFINMLCEITGGYVFQGVGKFYWVNAAPFNVDPAMEAIARLRAKFPRVEVKLFDLNAFGDGVFDRADAVLLSMLAYLRPDSNVPTRADVSSGQDIAAKYKTWKKRGRDPQKLRSLFPDGLLLPNDAEVDIGPEVGKGHFERIVGVIQKEINVDSEAGLR